MSFAAQQQSPPGVQARMNPVPDCGETSYRGSEKLTGKRAIVIHVTSPDEVTCRFADGRLEDRFTFELDPLLPLLGSILSFVIALFGYGTRDRPNSIAEQVRPLLVRRAAS